MNDQIKKRLKRTALLSLAALAVGAELGFAEMSARGPAPENAGAPAATVTMVAPMAGIEIGGPFTLTDQDGKTVTEKTYEGKYMLVYFGFTSCPMICPTGLRKMAQVMDKIGNPPQMAPVFITVDPERDTPEVMKDYVKQFHPRLAGLTGSKGQVESVEKTYRVFAARAQDESLSDYTMDHSSFTYLMSPDGKLLALYRDSDTADYMADDIRKKIN